MEAIYEDSQWVYCPICGNKTRTKAHEDTVMYNFPLYCPKCKTEVRVDIAQLKIDRKQISPMQNTEPATPITM